ncbi:MAG: hypothetical protein WCA45_00025 [Thiobacillaceae bacterium]
MHKLLPSLLGCLMAAPAASLALGLGEIKLQSYLGQPLKASIPVLAGPGEVIEENCFEVKADNAGGLPGVAGINIVLQRQAGGARLLLTSRHSVNEPAVAISVISDCPQRLTRQYMVLLDPPVIMETPALPKVEVQAEGRPIPLAHPVRAARTAGHRAAARSRARPARTHVHHASHPRLARSGPRLIVSGRNQAITGTAPSGLRMGASPPSPGKDQVSPPGSAEVADKDALLNRKLDYLEKQLAYLQRRNAELDQAARKTQAARPAPKPVAASGNPWLSWLVGLALLTAGALLAWRWRRMRKTRLHFSETDLWSVPLGEEKPAGHLETFAEDIEVQPPAQQDVPLAVAEATEPPASLAPVHTPVAAKWLDKNRATGNGMEVDDSVVDEVEVFMAHGHADLAINLLEEHLRIAPDESPIPWMLLLDLLKRQKLAKAFEEARIACKQHFNIRIPDLDEDDPEPGAAGLEAYPHILAELTRLWGTPECQSYLDDLIFDRRGGIRVGFHPPAYREIMLLRTMQADESPPASARYRAY